MGLADTRALATQLAPTTGMSDLPKKRAWVWWALLAIFVLYPLSIGPAFWWASAEGPFFFGDRWGTLSTVYAPLGWLAEHSS
jgi:hypothetical protein